MHRITGLIVALISLSTPVFAEIIEPQITVLTTQSIENSQEIKLFSGLWRFADRPQGDAIGSYACEKVILGKPEDNSIEIWYFGTCDVVFTDDDLGISGEIVFEFKASHAFVALNVSQLGVVTFADPLRAGSTLSLREENGVGIIQINLLETNIEPNGFTGTCRYEYVYTHITPKLGLRNSCDGQPTYLPLGTTWGFFVAGRDRNPVHVSHWGNVLALEKGRVYANNNAVGIRTVEVTITPSTLDTWKLEAVDAIASGARTLRLGQDNQYHLRVTRNGFGYGSAIFQLPDECGDRAHRIEVPNVGPFFVQVLCGTELPAKASNAG